MAQGAKILVVHGSLSVALGIARLLQVLGHEVETACDVEAAMEAARAHRPELILIDLALPAMGAHELARRLREESLARDALVIGIADDTGQAGYPPARIEGIDHYQEQPLDYEFLHDLVSAYLRRPR